MFRLLLLPGAKWRQLRGEGELVGYLVMRWGAVSFHGGDSLVVCDIFDGFSFSGGVCDEGGHECDARPDCGV